MSLPDDLNFDRPLLVAEIGGNHGGDLKEAYELARLAAGHGADVVKFQTFTADGLVNRHLTPDRHEHFKRLELPMEEWKRMAEYVRGLGAEWMTSLWDLDAFDIIEPLLPAFKIGSGDFTNYPLLARAVQTNKPLILSTAMCSMEDVRRTVAFLLKLRPGLIDAGHLALLQCTAMYDAPGEPETHVGVLGTFADAFPGIVVGYSNHYLGLDACVAALALGAQILEVHFTTDRTGSFRDHRLSVLPDELAQLREQCDRIPSLIGDREKRVAPLEKDEAVRFRRAVYSTRELAPGEVLSTSDLVTLRPEIGIPAWRYFEIVGRTVARPLEAYQPLSPDDLSPPLGDAPHTEQP